MGEEKFIRQVIMPATRGQNCPICLKSLEGWWRSSSSSVAVLKRCLHPYCEGCINKWSQIKRRCPLCNAQLDSWFRASPRLGLRLHRLPGEGSSVNSRPHDSRASWRPSDRSWRRTKLLPWRRRFEGRTAEEIAERKLRWRATVYHRALRAVPLPSSSATAGMACKERVAERIGPWIKRELQAVLGDPDPSIIVHLVSSLYFDAGGPSEGDFLAPLRPFLREWTDAFWHELKCFAGSSLTLDTYDSIVQYD